MSVGYSHYICYVQITYGGAAQRAMGRPGQDVPRAAPANLPLPGDRRLALATMAGRTAPSSLRLSYGHYAKLEFRFALAEGAPAARGQGNRNAGFTG